MFFWFTCTSVAHAPRPSTCCKQHSLRITSMFYFRDNCNPSTLPWATERLTTNVCFWLVTYPLPRGQLIVPDWFDLSDCSSVLCPLGNLSLPPHPLPLRGTNTSCRCMRTIQYVMICRYLGVFFNFFFKKSELLRHRAVVDKDHNYFENFLK